MHEQTLVGDRLRSAVADFYKWKNNIMLTVIYPNGMLFRFNLRQQNYINSLHGPNLLESFVIGQIHFLRHYQTFPAANMVQSIQVPHRLARDVRSCNIS